MDDSQNADAPSTAELGSEQGPSRRPRTLGRRRKWAVTTAVVGALAAVPTVAFTVNGSASAATRGASFAVLGSGTSADGAHRIADDLANARCGAGQWAATSEDVTGSGTDWTDELTGYCLVNS